MQIETVTETGSTNDDLLARAAAGAPEGTWLRAVSQTGGKGRQGRVWSSPPGNLYASTLVRLRSSDPPAPTLALVAAVALHEAMSQLAPGMRIKWPNDLIAGEAKLAGILLERAGESVVIGFGANLAHHPVGLDKAVTSIAALTGLVHDPADAVKHVAGRFSAWLARWRNEGLGPVRAAWLSNAHPLGTALSTPEGDGRFGGLDESGALRLGLADGSFRLIHAGDVFLI